MLLYRLCPFNMKKGKWMTIQFKTIYQLIQLLNPVSCRWTTVLLNILGAILYFAVCSPAWPTTFTWLALVYTAL